MAPITISDIPPDVHAALEARAATHGRTVAEEAAAVLTASLRPARRHSLLELDGLGKELWEGIDTAAYIDEERRSWD